MAVTSRALRFPFAAGLWTILIVEAVVVAWLQHPWVYPDSALYLELAANIAGDGFVADGEPNALRTPGYPLFLSALFGMGLNHLGVIAVQMALYLASVWLVGHRLIRSPETRLAFLSLAVVYVFPLFYSAALLSEALTIFCVTLALVLMMTARRPWDWLAVGAVVGFGSLVRTDVLPILPVAASLPFFRLDPKRAWVAAALVVAAALAVLGPYMAWNLENFGKATPVPVASTIGQSLYITTWEKDLATDDMKMIGGGSDPTPAAIASGFARQVQRIERLPELDRSSAYLDAAIERIRDNPAPTVLHTIVAPWRLFNSTAYPRAVSVPLHLVSGIVWVLGVAGMMLAVRDRSYSLIPLAVLLAFLVPHLPLHSEARYTAAVRLILLFYAASAVGRTVLLISPSRASSTTLTLSSPR